MFSREENITWIASYPKSGNTWVRCLLQAYRTNGFLDINDMHTGVGDSASMFTQAVSPVPLDQIGTRGLWLLRPAALVQAVMAKPVPRFFKTHYANLWTDGLPPFIPPELTKRAIYVVRDPRSVVLSMAKFYSLAHEVAVERMRTPDFCIGMSDLSQQVPTFVSSWTNHVSSWVGDKTKFPVHLVRYEDLQADACEELRKILEFCEMEVDEERLVRAVEASELDELRRKEETSGFAEYATSQFKQKFFGNGGSRWKDELGDKWIKQIEEDHGKLMHLLDYLEEDECPVIQKPTSITPIASG
jgi:hypothetical protein